MEWTLFGQILALLLFAGAILWTVANIILADARGWAAKAQAVPGERYLVTIVLILGAAAAFWLVPSQSPPRGGLTPAEERKLDEAAKMLDDNMIDVLPDSLAANEAEMEALEADVNSAGIPAGNAE